MKHFVRLSIVIVLLFAGIAACSRMRNGSSLISSSKLSGPLISSKMSMATAWDYPRNPLSDPSLDDSKLSNEIKWGFRIFTDTPHEAPQFAPGKISCNNCHLNGGQRERSLPLVAVAGVFPEYNKRSGRLYSLADRIVDCFLRSENATGAGEGAEDAGEQGGAQRMSLPTPSSREVLAISAYLTWLARGYEVGKSPAWRGQNTVDPAHLIPVATLDAQKGQDLFIDRCSNCHGEDGQGVAIGDKKPGPLWGPNSWNDGAGAARVYTLAGIIRYSMPYMNPGSLTDEEAQQLAAFINSKPRPSYPFKQQDYLTEKLPPDSVYYSKR